MSPNNQQNEEKSTLLTDVCSDCLDIIFDHLDTNDLASFALASPTFKEVVANNFFRKFNNSIAESSHRGSKTAKLEKIRNLLKAFGEEMHSLEASSIDGWHSNKPNDHSILLLIKKYFCANAVQKELQLKEFHFDESMVETLNFVFTRLSKLKLMKCKLLDGTEQLFANCVNLTKLKFDFVHTNPAVEYKYAGRKQFAKYTTGDDPDPCFNNCFPKLISLSLRSIDTATVADLANFLSKNPQLKKLKIVECREFDGVVQSVIEHVPNIEKLHLHAKYVKEEDLVQLEQLKKLVLQFNHINYENVYSALDGIARSKIRLDTLKIIVFRVSGRLITSLTGFKTLKKLELVVDRCFPDSKLQKLSQALPETKITVL